MLRQTEDDGYGIGHPSIAEKAQAQAELIEEIFDVIDEMPKQRKAVAELTIIDRQSVKQAALALKLAERTVYTHRDEALKTLRRELGNHPFFDMEHYDNIND